MERIVARADGVPLFTEELTSTVLESGEAGSSTVPATLQASLTERLDRLGEAKELAQIGAAVGRRRSSLSPAASFVPNVSHDGLKSEK